MVHTPLQSNSLYHLRRTLEYLTSADAQRLYKAKVPFVHVPGELLEQWGTSIRYLRETSWFRSLFDSVQAAAMERFDVSIRLADANLGKHLPDVPEIFEHAVWCELGHEAQRLLAVLPSAESDEFNH